MRRTRRILVGVASAAVLGGVGTAFASSGGSAASTGLANAISHVQANEAAHPNKGLANALTHLQANQAKHGTH